MKRAALDVEFVTPAFLGGAAPRSEDARAEWRAASIRGQWRWWFRALAGPHLGGDPKKVAAAEAAVFGSTRGASLLQVRAEPVDLKVQPAGASLGGLPRRKAAALAEAWGIAASHHLHEATVQRLKIRRGRNPDVPTNTVAYLSYGCLDWQGELQRSCITAESKARIVLQWRPSRWKALDAHLRQLAAQSLQAWFLLGGIGSKARKGFGSLLLAGLDGEMPAGFEVSASVPTRDALQAALGQLRAQAGTGATGASPTGARPQWSQLGADARIYLGLSTPSWQDALDRVGGWLIAFRRRYGIADDPREDLRNRDYEWHKARGEAQGSPDRAGFGLPLPFGEGGPVASAVGGGTEGSLRRASPLLIHIARTAPSGYVPILAHLGGAFLPPGARVELTRQNGRQLHSTKPTPEQLSVVDRFLDDLAGKKLITPVESPA